MIQVNGHFYCDLDESEVAPGQDYQQAIEYLLSTFGLGEGQLFTFSDVGDNNDEVRRPA